MSGVHNPFARTMSLAVHELRTPVSVASGYLRMLLRNDASPLTDTQRKMLLEAERSCQRLHALVAEMSDLSRLDAGEATFAAKEVDMAALVSAVASNMHVDDDRNVALSVRGAGRPLLVSGDPARLQTVMEVLVRSAVRERGEPGTIMIECAVTPGTPAMLQIAIGDDAALRALSEHPDTLGAFDEYRGGLGLLLPIAARVVAAHNGLLWGISTTRPRAGSVLRLPLKAPASA